MELKNGKEYCEQCAKAMCTECDDCGGLVKRLDLIETEKGELFCSDCINNVMDRYSKNVA